jgi:hypothetical protein
MQPRFAGTADPKRRCNRRHGRISTSLVADVQRRADLR